MAINDNDDNEIWLDRIMNMVYFVLIVILIFSIFYLIMVATFKQIEEKKIPLWSKVCQNNSIITKFQVKDEEKLSTISSYIITSKSLWKVDEELYPTIKEGPASDYYRLDVEKIK